MRRSILLSFQRIANRLKRITASLRSDPVEDLHRTATPPTGGEDNYPPHNIERLADDRYQISLAVAGFSPDEITLLVCSAASCS